MPRYMVERNFPDGLNIPIDRDGAAATLNVVNRNKTGEVTWVQSFVTPEKNQSFCLYDGPNPEAIKAAASRSGLPCDRVTEVRVLDPYFYY